MLVKKRVYAVLFVVCLVFVTAPQMWKSYQAAIGLKFAWTTSKVWLAELYPPIVDQAHQITRMM